MMQTHANEGFEVSRGNSIRIGRPVVVWATVSAGAAAAADAVPGAWRVARTAPTYDRVEDLVVAVCATGLALALGWLWVVTTTTVVGLVTGRSRPEGGVTRRLVLLMCGAAVLAGTSVPATAAGGDGRDLLAGLTLPERAVAPAQAPHPSRAASATTARDTYVVRAGDSLWSIARQHPGGSGSVDERWRAIWLANRDVVGDDPDLIIPGQALRLPTHHPLSDGDR